MPMLLCLLEFDELLLLLIVVEVASDVVHAKPYTNDIYNAGGLPQANDIYTSAMGDYGVSIIHINSSTIAISVVEPQNDADTFINSCGETGERPAIRVMITIHDARATARLTDIDEEVHNITIDVAYSDDEDGFNFNNIVLALAKQKLDDVKVNAALDTLCGLGKVVAGNKLRVNAYMDIITAASDCAKAEGLSLTEYLVKIGQ